MFSVLCVDLDDDLGCKTGLLTPVVSRQRVEDAVMVLATADPEDSNVNVLFQGIQVHDELFELEDEEVEIAAVTGLKGSDVKANHVVGDEIDTVLASLSTGESVHAIVITGGVQDESVLSVIRSRVPTDGIHRVVVRWAQNFESMYYTMKQVLADPGTRGTTSIPLGTLPLTYPFVTIASLFDVPGAVVLGLISVLLGLYTPSRGLGLESAADEVVDRARNVLYVGRVTIITYVAAAALPVVDGIREVELLETVSGSVTGDPPARLVLATLAHGVIEWFAAAGITSSLGQVTGEYPHDRFKWRYPNAPFYALVVAIALYALSGFSLPKGVVGVQTSYLPGLAVALTVGTPLGVLSTLTFAMTGSCYPTGSDGENEQPA